MLALGIGNPALSFTVPDISVCANIEKQQNNNNSVVVSFFILLRIS